ncbi:MAG TPA: alpha/beta family hydrolase [Acidimicrobiales bacterium]|nr:alpha/beta family hydrolase [Acidimicrobiales bacterium]
MTASPSPAAALLAPGAGSGGDHSCLVAIEAALAPLPVERMDFPYRKRGRKAPDRAPVLLAAVVEAATALAAEHGLGPARLVLGGRSMGGRMCSMAVAEGLPAAGLVLVSYPLHPPGRPDRLRTAHLPRLQVPCLFVSGTRDAFATPAELEAATAAIPGPVEHVWVEGGRHELKGADQTVAAAVAAWVRALGPPARRPAG